MKNFSKGLKPFKINGKYYIFDIPKIFEKIEQDIYQKEITSAYDFNEGDQMTSRVIREVENRDVATIGNLRYDFLKTLIITVIEWPMTVNMVNGVEKVEMSNGLAITLNTLIHEGILKEINVTEDEQQRNTKQH